MFLIALTIIEQLGGATHSMFQLGSIAMNANRTLVLPGISKDGLPDHTVYRSVDRPSIADYNDYFVPVKMNSPDCLGESFRCTPFRQHMKTHREVDAILIMVTRNEHRPLMKLSDAYVIDCQHVYEKCLKNATLCGPDFMWPIYVGEQDDLWLNDWPLKEGGHVFCVDSRLRDHETSLQSVLLQHPVLSLAENVAILNWTGEKCYAPGLYCGNNEQKEAYLLTCVAFSSSMHKIADEFIAAHESLRAGYNALQLRAEMLLFRNIPVDAVVRNFNDLSWFNKSASWFRASDLKGGGSQTAEHNKDRGIGMTRLIAMVDNMWAAMGVQFIDLECSSYDHIITCTILDIILLARAHQLHTMNAGGGFAGLILGERKNLGRKEIPQKHNAWK